MAGAFAPTGSVGPPPHRCSPQPLTAAALDLTAAALSLSPLQPSTFHRCSPPPHRCSPPLFTATALQPSTSHRCRLFDYPVAEVDPTPSTFTSRCGNFAAALATLRVEAPLLPELRWSAATLARGDATALWQLLAALHRHFPLEERKLPPFVPPPLDRAHRTVAEGGRDGCASALEGSGSSEAAFEETGGHSCWGGETEGVGAMRVGVENGWARGLEVQGGGAQGGSVTVDIVASEVSAGAQRQTTLRERKAAVHYWLRNALALDLQVDPSFSPCPPAPTPPQHSPPMCVCRSPCHPAPTPPPRQVIGPGQLVRDPYLS